MIEIEKPKIECVEDPANGTYGKFTVEPLERGYGITLGNALRRIMLSSLPGTAATSIKIAGVQHEFSTIPGVKEDVTEIVLNVKSLITRLHNTDGIKTVYIEAVGPCEVKAGDIKGDSEVEVLNPDLHIATLDAGATLNMELTLSHGRGYVSADRNKTDEFTCGGIAAYNYATGVVDQCVNHASITAMNQVGGVVGMNGGKVIGSGNTGAITANYYFGGVVGYTTSSSAACVIEKCYNTGTLTMDEPAGMGRGAAYMGGVTSRIYSNKTVISKCYNTGDLIVGASVSSSSLRIGGIVGHTNKPGRLTDCYNAGNATIKGKANYGGIVGEMADQAAVITNCYTVGKITVDGGSGNLFSAFGKASGKAVITDCYALDNGDAFAGGSTSGITGGGLLSEAQMKNPASYSGWDFVTVWQAGGGSYPYPTLR